MQDSGYSQDDLKEMIEQCKRTLAADPNQVDKILALGRLLHLAGRTDEALEQFGKALTINPRALDAYRLRASVFWDSGELDKALADCDKVLGLEGFVAEDYITRGLVRERMENIKGALDDFSDAIVENPELSEAYRCRGNALGRTGEFKQALIDFNRVIGMDPSAENFVSRGAVWECLNDISNALKDYSAAIEKDPNNMQAYKIRANLYFQTGKLEDALADFDRVVEAESDVPENLLLRGTIKEHLDDIYGAIDDYTKAIALRPDFARAMKRRGNLLARQDEFTGAARDFSEALSLDATDVEAYLSLGLLMECQNDPSGALQNYSKAIELRPDIAESYRRRARLFLTQHQLPEAIEDLNEAIKLEDLPDDFVTRGYVKECSGNRQEAMDDYSLAIAKDERCLRAWKLRGLLYASHDQFAEALQDFDKLMSLGDDSPDTFLIRGMARECLNDFDAALADYSQALSRDESFIEAYKYRARLLSRTSTDLQGALADFEKLASLGEASAEILLERASIKEQLGDWEGAVDDYSSALEIERAADTYVFRGAAYAQGEQFEAACSDFDKALELDASHIGAVVNRYFVLRQMGDYDSAVLEAERLIELRPDLDVFLVYRGEALAFVGRVEEAVSICNSYIQEQREQTAPFLMLLALTQFLSANYAESSLTFFRAYEEFLKDEPGNACNALVFSMLAHRKSGSVASQRAEIEEAVRQHKNASIWPAPVLRFLLAELDYDELLKLSSTQAEKTDVHTASGIIRAVSGDVTGAREHLSWSQENGVSCYEKLLAIHELRNLPSGLNA